MISLALCYLLRGNDLGCILEETGMLITSENKLLDLSFKFAVAIVNLVDDVTVPKNPYYG